MFYLKDYFHNPASYLKRYELTCLYIIFNNVENLSKNQKASRITPDLYRLHGKKGQCKYTLI